MYLSNYTPAYFFLCNDKNMGGFIIIHNVSFLPFVGYPNVTMLLAYTLPELLVTIGVCRTWIVRIFLVEIRIHDGKQINVDLSVLTKF